MENPYKPFREDGPEDPEAEEGSFPPEGRKVRLRALESESTYFLKLMNISAIRWLAIVQAVASGLVILAQILMYSTAHTRYYKIVDYMGIGIWGPVLFFFVGAGLVYLTSKSPSGCMIGSTMGLQITSLIVALLLLMFAIISLIQHGYYSYGDNTYNAEVPGRVFCSFMILSAAGVAITAFFISIHLCRAVCCGRQRIAESLIFDVETVK